MKLPVVRRGVRDSLVFGTLQAVRQWLVTEANEGGTNDD